MKKLYLLSCLFSSPLWAQRIANVRFLPHADKEVHIYYDILDAQPSQTFEIGLECTFVPTLKNWQRLEKVSGDVGTGILAGANKRIVWRSLEEYGALDAKMAFKVKAVVQEPQNNTNQGPITGTAGIKMLFVEGGMFRMGSETETPMHDVTLSSFYMSETEVTQAQYQSVMGKNPSSFKGCENCPVERVSWYEAIEYCNALSKKEGLTPVYTIDKNRKDPNNQNSYDALKWTVSCDWSANGYRLPTEAEWEYAARGGKQSKGYRYAGGDVLDEVAWHDGNSQSKTHAVKGKKANELGLYDMSGNIWEWCWDWKGSYRSDAEKNPEGSTSGPFRVLRGGSWFTDSEYCRAAYRDFNYPDDRGNDLGFRLVMRPAVQ